jgi:hypothetical protein
MLRKIFGYNRDEMTEVGVNYVMRSLIIFTLHQMLLG